MEKGRIAALWLTSADAADLFEGPRPEERTLIDACRTPFSFGLSLLIPVALMLAAFVLILYSRPTLTKRVTLPLGRSTFYQQTPRDLMTARRAQP
jgi:hypothetical protein